MAKVRLFDTTCFKGIENYGDYCKEVSILLWDRRSDTFNLECDVTYHLSSDTSQIHGGADPNIV